MKTSKSFSGKDVEIFMKEYRPDYEFTINSNVVDFYQYILNSSYEYKINREKENYIDSRFNTELVKTITALPEKDLDVFMKKYRPGYEFTHNSSPQEFYDYVLNASNEFKKQQLAISGNINNPTDSSSLHTPHN